MDNHTEQRETAFFAWIFNVALNWFYAIGSFALLVYIFNVAQAHNFTFAYVLVLVGTFLLVWFFVGSRQHALSLLGHDGAHGLVTQNLFINDLLTRTLTFSAFGVSLKHYRSFHFTHHQHLSTPLDPELKLKKDAEPSYDLPIKGISSMLYLSLKDMLGLSYAEIFDFVLNYAIPKTFKDSLHIIGWWSAVLFCIFYFQVTYAFIFLAFWFFCLGTSFWTCFRLRVFIEHLGTEGVHRVRPSRIAQFILYPYNTWCHFEHHANPNVAAVKLPELRKTLSPEVKEIGVLDIYRLHAESRYIPSGMPLRED